MSRCGGSGDVQTTCLGSIDARGGVRGFDAREMLLAYRMVQLQSLVDDHVFRSSSDFKISASCTLDHASEI